MLTADDSSVSKKICLLPEKAILMQIFSNKVTVAVRDMGQEYILYICNERLKYNSAFISKLGIELLQNTEHSKTKPSQSSKRTPLNMQLLI